MKIIIIVLAVILILIIGLSAYLFIVDPAGVFQGNNGSQVEVSPDGNLSPERYEDLSQNSNVDENPILSVTQEQSLIQLGVDPAALPKEITPDMLECLNNSLGEERTDYLVNQGGIADYSELSTIGKCLNLY